MLDFEGIEARLNLILNILLHFSYEVFSVLLCNEKPPYRNVLNIREQSRFILYCASHLCYTQQNKLNCITLEIRTFSATVHATIALAVNHTAAVSSGVQHRHFISKNVKLLSIRCPVCVKVEQGPTPTIARGNLKAYVISYACQMSDLVYG